MVSFSKPCMKQPFSSGAGLLSTGSHTSQALSAAVVSGRPSRFAGGQRTARCPPSIFRRGPAHRVNRLGHFTQVELQPSVAQVWPFRRRSLSASCGFQSRCV